MSSGDERGLGALLAHLSEHERRARRGLNLTPSENTLSPLARLPFLLDTYSRYFLDDLRLFGKWFFHGGRDLGAIEQTVLHPVLKALARASFVNTRPLSGINGMTIALAALAKPGEAIFTVPMTAGGHASTSVVAARLGLDVHAMPFRDAFDLDLDRLAGEVAAIRPALLYLDQSTELFPLDPAPLRALVDSVSPATRIHYDSSHVNGLILGGALPNPLERGAHSFGGSTHKTLPGPHKAFFATNDDALLARYQAVCDHFVSHSHMADTVSLAITLLEMRDCGGETYARGVLANARAFAEALQEDMGGVAAGDRGFTGCHQVWAVPPADTGAHGVAATLLDAGLVVNTFDGLPGVPRPAFRFSIAEATRLGMERADAIELARIVALAARGASPAALRPRVDGLRERLRHPRYCYTLADLHRLGIPDEFERACQVLFAETGGDAGADRDSPLVTPNADRGTSSPARERSVPV